MKTSKPLTTKQKLDELARHFSNLCGTHDSVFLGLEYYKDNNVHIYSRPATYGAIRMKIAENPVLGFSLDYEANSYYSNYSHDYHRMHGYNKIIEPFLYILSYMGYQVYNLERNKEGTGAFIELDGEIYGFCSRIHYMPNTTPIVDGCSFKLEGLKKTSSVYKELKKTRKAVKDSLDMLVTTDILAEFAKQYPKEKYKEIALIALNIQQSLDKKGNSVSLGTPAHDASIAFTDTREKVLKIYLASLKELADTEDKLTIFMEKTLPTMAGIVQYANGEKTYSHRYPTMQALQHIIDGQYYKNDYYKPAIKDFVRGVDRIAQFMEEKYFTYRKITKYDRKSISKMV